MKASKIVLPENPRATQMSLFPLINKDETSGLPFEFPEVLLTRAGFDRVLDSATDALGLDLEFSEKTEKPSIAGIAVRNLAASIPWDERVVKNAVEWCQKAGIKLVGHSVLGADRPVVEKALGVKTSLNLWEDTLLMHYLLNADFCKSPEKQEDEGALGFMNIWCMASMTTNAPQWKVHRGKVCEGPCPSCAVFDYNGIDAWAGIEGYYVMREQMEKFRVPYAYYRELMELSEVCDAMERQGLRIDIPYIEKLNVEMEEKKDSIFAYEVFGKSREYESFNPKSPKQIMDWFAGKGIPMKSADIKYVTKVLEKRGLREGHGEFKEYVEFLEECGEDIPSPTKELFRLYQFKSSGKGTDAWYSEKYRDGSFIHPRFIVTGTSTGRLASSRPNFQNIPTRGWAVVRDENGNKINRIKAGILPRDESLEYLEADFSQLELRDCLWLSGVDPRDAGDDAFSWLVKMGEGLFEKAGADMATPMSGRDAAKSMSHAGNYMEGMDVYYADDLMKPGTIRQIKNGSLRLYAKKYMPELKKDWEYCGGIVGFNGSNLALRFFGNKSEEARKKALGIQEDIYFKKFPMIRRWQMKVLAEIEATGMVRSPTGRFLRLYDTPRNNAKVGVAFLGQGVGAEHASAVTLRYKRELGVIPDLLVHDSMLWGLPKTWTDKKMYDFIAMMGEETWRLPGFVCPFKAKRGPNYGTLRDLRP